MRYYLYQPSFRQAVQHRRTLYDLQGLGETPMPPRHRGGLGETPMPPRHRGGLGQTGVHWQHRLSAVGAGQRTQFGRDIETLMAYDREMHQLAGYQVVQQVGLGELGRFSLKKVFKTVLNPIKMTKAIIALHNPVKVFAQTKRAWANPKIRKAIIIAGVVVGAVFTGGAILAAVGPYMATLVSLAAAAAKMAMAKRQAAAQAAAQGDYAGQQAALQQAAQADAQVAAYNAQMAAAGQQAGGMTPGYGPTGGGPGSSPGGGGSGSDTTGGFMNQAGFGSLDLSKLWPLLLAGGLFVMTMPQGTAGARRLPRARRRR